MDKRVAVLLVAAMALLLNVCEVTCKPIDRIKSKATSVIRTIGLYADPFGWIGKPNWPTRSNRRKKSDGHRYRWFIEIDESDHWWITVYDGQSQIPGPGKKTIMKLF